MWLSFASIERYLEQMLLFDFAFLLANLRDFTFACYYFSSEIHLRLIAFGSPRSVSNAILMSALIDLTNVILL